MGKPCVVRCETALSSQPAYVQSHNGESEAFEAELIEALLKLRQEWQKNKDPFRLEFYTIRSVPDETMRAVISDLPLVPCVFLIMSIFTCAVFWRNDRVQSRALVGLGSVITILFSLMSGFGIAFICGFPFTSMTQILPFVGKLVESSMSSVLSLSTSNTYALCYSLQCSVLV